MGVLLALGARKKNIVGQIATELLIVGTIGFVLASVSGTFLAKGMGQGILESQIAASSQQSERSFGRPGAQMSNGNSGAPEMPDRSSGGNMKQRIMANRSDDIELDINAKPMDFLMLFVTGYAVIVLALIMPSINILRYQPKEILTGKE